MSILRLFGCLAYAVNVSPMKRKFDPISHKCASVGYDIQRKGYLLYSLHTHTIFTSRDVMFFTETCPFSTAVEREPEQRLPLIQIADNDETMLEDDAEVFMDNTSTEDTLVVSASGGTPVVESDVVPLCRSSRAHNPPKWMQDYVGSLQVSAGFVVGTSVTPPIFPYTILPNLSLPYVTYLLNISTTHEPTSYQEASTQTEWVKAMQDELYALESNHT